MPWFRNKRTGLVWEVIDKRLVDRLKKDGDYEETKKPVKPKKEAPESEDIESEDKTGQEGSKWPMQQQ